MLVFLKVSIAHSLPTSSHVISVGGGEPQMRRKTKNDRAGIKKRKGGTTFLSVILSVSYRTCQSGMSQLKKRAAKRNWFLVWALRCKCFWRLLWKSLIFFRQVEEKKTSSTSSLLRDTNKMSQKLWSDQCMCGTTKNVQASVLSSSPLTPHCGQFVCKDPQNSSEVPSTKVLIRSRSLSVLKIFPYSHVTKSICDSSCKFVCPNIKSEIRAHPISTVFFSLTQLNKQQLTLTSTWPKM